MTEGPKGLVDRVLSFIDLDIRRRGTRWHRARDLPRVPTVVDVGIGKGGTPPLYGLFPESRFILIDPLEECRAGVRALLEREGNVFVPAALGAESGSVEIHIPADVSRSTLLEPADPGGGGEVETRTVPLRRLDDVLSELDVELPLGLKVDTEGYELQVLDGARESLRRTAFVILEVNVRERFEGSYRFEDAIRYMSDAGFSVHAVLHAGTGKCDIAFTRNSEIAKGEGGPMTRIEVPVSAGELLDKISILEIKARRIDDRAKVENVRRELEALREVWGATGFDGDGEVDRIREALRDVNDELWEIEDRIREKEAERSFDDEFIQLARSVYLTNDRRAALKRELNVRVGSELVEEKSYADYGSGGDEASSD